MNLNMTYIVVLATMAELENPHYLDLLRKALKDIGISGMGVIDALSNMAKEGKLIIYPTGKTFALSPLDLERIFPMWSERNYYNFLNNDRSGKLPRDFYRDFEKILMYDLFLRFYEPGRAKAIIENCSPVYNKLGSQ